MCKHPMARFSIARRWASSRGSIGGRRTTLSVNGGRRRKVGNTRNYSKTIEALKNVQTFETKRLHNPNSGSLSGGGRSFFRLEKGEKNHDGNISTKLAIEPRHHAD